MPGNSPPPAPEPEHEQARESSLEATSRKRKERLNALRELKRARLPLTEAAAVEAEVTAFAARALADAPALDADADDGGGELDLAQLAPKKPTWDLKRDLARKTEPLERRTAAAIADLIRERLRRERQQGDGEVPDLNVDAALMLADDE